MYLPDSVSSYSAAYLGGQVDQAYAYVSPRCRRVVSKPVFAKKLLATSARYGKQDIRVYSDSIGTDPTRAEVNYQFDVKALNQFGQKWVKTGGRWHNDTC